MNNCDEFVFSDSFRYAGGSHKPTPKQRKYIMERTNGGDQFPNLRFSNMPTDDLIKEVVKKMIENDTTVTRKSLGFDYDEIKPLLCFDINGILCKLIHKYKNETTCVDENVIVCKGNKIKFVPRPDLDKLLLAVKDYFDIAFYTSRTEENARAILNALCGHSDIFKEIFDSKVKHVLTQANCERDTIDKKWYKCFNNVTLTLKNKDGKLYDKRN